LFTTAGCAGNGQLPLCSGGQGPTPRSASTSLAVSGPRPVAGVAAGAPDVRRPSSLAWKDVGGHPGAALL